jgi:hypothetical protein
MGMTSRAEPIACFGQRLAIQLFSPNHPRTLQDHPAMKAGDALW